MNIILFSLVKKRRCWLFLNANFSLHFYFTVRGMFECASRNNNIEEIEVLYPSRLREINKGCSLSSLHKFVPFFILLLGLPDSPTQSFICRSYIFRFLGIPVFVFFLP